MGLDDFAFCKGHTYGTLVCDLQSKAPLALLPNRLPETVTSWLKKYPFIELVSRDGFTGFRQGIKNASNTITQIYDRWHFIRNAKKQLDSFLATIMPASIKWSIPESHPTEIPLTRAEQPNKNRQNKKWELIQDIQIAHKKGKNISRLAREYNLDRRTIYQYLNMKEPPVFHRFRNRPTDKYYEQIIKLEQEGNTVKEIYSSIQNQGYTGTFSGVRSIVKGSERNVNLVFQKRTKYLFLEKNYAHGCGD
ncbi:transposase [Neobacillus sp. OS1-2]|uniref:transposase n=1 Tax=Neobacillus sp. OS1-2 TaxID=3070680 RepID=UPI0027E0F0D4|nr:transposase [Neobacillus sp. OS1-2]WML37961.1 transposase [Neobacillus sp. OS1-2]